MDTLFKYKPFFVDLMMTQELLLQKPRYSPVKNGTWTHWTLGSVLYSQPVRRQSWNRFPSFVVLSCLQVW